MRIKHVNSARRLAAAFGLGLLMPLTYTLPALAAVTISQTVPTSVPMNEWMGVRANYVPTQNYTNVKVVIEVWEPGNCTSAKDARILDMPGQNLTSGVTYRYSASYYPIVASTATNKYRFGFGLIDPSTGAAIAYSVPACGSGMSTTPMMLNNGGWALSGLYTSTDTVVNPALARYNLAVTQNDPNLDIYKRYSQIPFPMWITTDMTATMKTRLTAHVQAAAVAGRSPIVVLYNIPDRDCQGGGAGSGANNTQAYGTWVNDLATAVGTNNVVYVVEPDALAQYNTASTLPCFRDNTWINNRKSLIGAAVTKLKTNPNAKVYIDAGHSTTWQTATEMANRLNAVNVAAANGFSLNVANRYSDVAEAAYGDDIRSKAGAVNGKHYVIDRSRNGNPATGGTWCDNTTAVLGALPTARVGSAYPNVDAFLWVKTAYTSDGCLAAGGTPLWPANVSSSTPTLGLDIAKASPSNW